MDAYVFAASATNQAVDALKAGVGQGGPARVVCPLTGDRRLYVAVAADDEEELRDKLDAVLATDGVEGAQEYIAAQPADDGSSFPTHMLVQAYVGFAIVEEASVSSALADVTVIGAAVTVDGALIVEVTGDDPGEVRRLLRLVPGADTAVGDTADGAGFRTS